MADFSDDEFEKLVAAAPSAEPAAPGMSDADFEAAVSSAPEASLWRDVKDAAGSVVDGAAALAQGAGQGALSALALPGKSITAAGSAALMTGVDALTGRDSTFAQNFQNAKNAQEDVRSASPTADVVGQVAGGLASSLATGGGVSALAAKAAPQLAAKVAAAGALGKLAASAAGVGAAEGAAQGVSSAIDDAILSGNWDHIASKVGEQALQGAAIGGIFGGAVSGLRGVASYARKGADAVADLFGRGEAALGKQLAGDLERGKALVNAAAEDVTQAQKRAAAMAAADVPVTSPDDVARVMDERAAQFARPTETPVFERDEMLAAAMDYDDQIARSTAQMRQDMDLLLDVRSQMQVEGGRAAKQRLFSGLADAPDTLADGVQGPVRAYNPLRDDYVRTLVGDVGAGAEKMLADGGAVVHAQGGGAQALRYLKMASAAYQDRVAAKLNSGAAGEAYNMLDNMKLSVGRLQRSRDPMVREYAEQAYEKLRVMLEDTRLWGDVGDQQRIFNAAYSREIAAESGQGVTSFLADSGKKSAYNPWENAEVANDAALNGLLRNAGGGISSGEDAFRNFIAATDASLSARAGVLGDAKLVERAKEARAAAERIRIALDDAARTRQALSQLTKDKMVSGDAAFASAVQNMALGAATVANPVIGGAVAAAGAANKAAKAILGASERMRAEAFIAAKQAARASRETAQDLAARQVAEAERRLAAAKDAFVREQAGLVNQARGAGKAAMGAASRGAASVGRGAEAIRKAAVAAREAQPGIIAAAQRIVDRMDDPDGMEAQALGAKARRVAAIGVGGPAMAGVYEQQAQAAQQLLGDVVGAPPKQSPFGKPPQRRVAPAQAQRIVDTAEALADPIRALEKMAQGTASPATRKALETVHRGLLTRFQQQVMQTLGEKTLSPEQVRRAATQLGVAYDDPVWSASLGMAQQAQQQPPKPSSKQYQQPQTASAADNVLSLDGK